MRAPFFNIKDEPDFKTLGFQPQPMVRWLSPRGLMITGGMVGVSGIFGAYADKREIQAALKEPSDLDLSANEDLWLDFMADTGDGFNPTYAVARALAEPSIDLTDSSGATHHTPRGDVLLLGGDIAYPAASLIEFNNRFHGPFRTAFPDVPEGKERPLMLAVAGNHDWLDGLTSFLRVFTDQARIGAWQTRQTRSYFITKLPHDWWLVCPDFAFDYFIDIPQMDFFRKVAKEQMKPSDKVILSLHRPYWLFGPLHSDPLLYAPDSDSNLHKFEREIIAENGLRMPLVLAGDIHHYNRYVSEGGQQRIVSGSGAAFIYPTHNLPETFQWADRGRLADFERKAIYPDEQTSKRARWGTLLAPFKNPSFVFFVGAIYLFFALLIRFGIAAGQGERFHTKLRLLGPEDLIQVLFNSPVSFFAIAVIGAGIVIFTDAKSWPRRIIIGVIHGDLHLLLIVTTVWLIGRSVPAMDPTLYALTFGAIVLVVGGYLGAQLFAIYLFLMQTLFKRHATHSFSSQHLQDYRSFVRLRFDDDGGLTLFPIGMRKVPRKWRYVAEREPADPWFEPVDRDIECHLIEEPFRIEPDAG